MRIAFTKCHGSGNDFALIDARADDLAEADWAGIARSLADRAGPVGSDGLYAFLFLSTAPARCSFTLSVTPPPGYTAPSALIPASTTSSTGWPLVWAQLLATPWATASATQPTPEVPGPVSPLTG